MHKFLFLGMLLSSSVLAGECEVTVSSNDQMKFDQQVISIPKSCSTFQVTLHHAGKLPKLVMGHNLVIVKKSELDAVANDAMAAGAGNDYLKVNDPRVLAHTPLIGGGEEGKATVDVKMLDANEQYVFFCSFPGHRAIMKGDVVLK